jgi:kynureninase
VERMPDERRAGFLAIRAPRAIELAGKLRRHGVFVDARGDVLRLGPAPYLADDQLRDSVAILGDELRSAR